MLKCKFEYCQYPNCEGEKCGLALEDLLALACAESKHWRETTKQMYSTAMSSSIRTMERELRRLLPQEYTPTCPCGFTDCISDPAYIRTYHPKWWVELGRPTQCSCAKDTDGDWCQYYDDEDK